MSKQIVSAMCLMVSTLAMADARAQAPASVASSPYPLSAPRYKTLIVETVFPYAVTQYAPPVPVPAVSASASRTTPEGVVFQMLAAMRAADYDWSISLWSAESRTEMQRRDKAAGQGREYWERLWRSSPKRSYTLLSRISYGKYVLIEYRDQAVADNSVTDTMALEQRDGVWYLTQALAADAILMHWDNPTGRIQQVPGSFLPK